MVSTFQELLAQAKSLIEETDPSGSEALISEGWVVLDVREIEEFSNSAIKGSISIPLSTLNQESELEFIKKESLIKEVFIICQSGKRSEKASKILSKFKIQSRSIDGGIEKVKKILCN